MAIEDTRSMTTDNTEVTMEEILGVLTKEEFEDFDKVMKVCASILEEPNKFIGMHSLIVATQLAAIRTRISARAQYYKTVQDKSITTRRKKDLCMSMYSALEENINTLKLLGRTESRTQNWN